MREKQAVAPPPPRLLRVSLEQSKRGIKAEFFFPGSFQVVGKKSHDDMTKKNFTQPYTAPLKFTRYSFTRSIEPASPK